jgi:molybdopterin synthase sulfur carrier subunit
MSIHIILFGRLADIAGNSVSVNGVSDTDSLVKTLHKNYPELANAKYVIAVNKQVVNQNTSLNADSVVALLPPFSGG